MKFKICKLGEICEFENGDRGKNYPSISVQTDEGIPFIKATHINKEGIITKNNMNFITKKRFDILSSGKTKKGDLVFCLRGSIGKAAIVDEFDDAAIAASIVIVRPNEKKIINKYLLYFFQSEHCKNQINKYKLGVAQQTLSAKSLSLFEINLPPIDEQHKIVNSIDSQFNIIKRNILINERRKKELDNLYASIITKQFFNKYQNSVVELKEISKIKGGKRIPKGKSFSENITKHPYIRVKDISDNGEINTKNLKYVDENIFKLIGRYLISAGDIFISIAGTIGRTALIPEHLHNSNLTENAAKITLNKEKVFPNYLYYFTKSSNFKSQINVATKQAAQPKLSLQNLMKIKIALCDLKNQKKIVTTLDKINRLIIISDEKIQQQLREYVSLKKSILGINFRTNYE